MSIRTITPTEAKRLIEAGACLVDIRGTDEHARERIAGARNLPLGALKAEALPGSGAQIVFHCRSGNRTASNADVLAAAAKGEAFILGGGIDAWKAAGLPVEQDRRQPIELMRQVQIAAGSLIVLGVALGALVHPGFFALSGFVGAGLVFAGVTGTCGMARLLMLAPWNRRARQLTSLAAPGQAG